MGKWPFEMLAKLRLNNEKASDDRSFFSPVGTLPNSRGKKTSSRKLHEGRRMNSSTDIDIFDFCENDYNSAGNSHFWAGSNFHIFANFGPSRTNDGALELSDRAGVIFAPLVEGRNNYKKIIIC